MPNNGKPKDIGGKEYNEWTVIPGTYEKVNGKTTWLCQCSCGKQARILRTVLVNNHATRCRSCAISKRMQDRKGSKHPAWKGGRISTGKAGYIRIWKPEHPGADKHNYVLEHVYVMSEHLGRPLVKGETVHHKNGVRDDNRIENLELWSSNHPSGQRVEDKLKWAHETIALYTPPQLGTSAGMLF